MTLTAAAHPITLLSDHAVMANDALILADTHFGKSAAFRARGIPVPEGDTVEDSGRIRALVETHSPTRLVIAGDLLHAPEGTAGSVVEILGELFHNLPCSIHLVLGNHDRRAGHIPNDWPVEIHERYEVDGLSVVHDPRDAHDESFTLCGHLHPVVRIKDGKNTSFRAPCFWLREHERQLVLPSFGTFTGGHVIRPAGDDRSEERRGGQECL